MDRQEALGLLNDPSSHVRLRAVRYLSRIATRRDLSPLKKRYREESVSFVKRALEQVIERLTSGRVAEPTPQPTEGVDDPIESGRVAYAKAVLWVTNSMLHEVLPRVGMIKVEARRSIEGYEESTLKKRIDDLTSVLRGIEELRKAAFSESIEQINLSDLIEDLATQEIRGTPFQVSVQGPKDLLVLVDPNLLRIAISNGLKNALEATGATGWNAPVVIAFGETEVDYWVTILDSGPGLAGPSERAFDIGRTTKSGHRGFGLALARQAMATLDGNISLQPAQSGGARLELRWFK